MGCCASSNNNETRRSQGSRRGNHRRRRDRRSSASPQSVTEDRRQTEIGQSTVNQSFATAPRQSPRSRISPRDRRLSRVESPVKAKKNPKHAQPEVYVAIFRYEPGCSSELALEKGDRVEIISRENEDFVFVRQLKLNGIRGFVPIEFLAQENTAEAESYFFGEMRRRQAVTTLMDNSLPPGAFLLRIGESVHADTSKGSEKLSRDEQISKYVLSVKDSASPPTVHHYRIRSNIIGKKFYIKKRAKFDNIRLLIQHYKGTTGQNEIAHSLTVHAIRPRPVRKELSKEMRERWREIPREQIELKDQLGEGKFGTVYKAVWKVATGQPVEVVAKCLKKGALADKQLLLDEASTMKDLCHDNIVRLYGVVSASEPYYIITEFVKDGALKDYLQKRRICRLPNLPAIDLIDMACQICRGMDYLSNKKVVHRDLATRNVLLDVKSESPFTAVLKIADFGLARALNQAQIYQMKTAAYLPIKWLAPEAFNFKFSSQTDIWAFGIVLYELFTGGDEPFEGFDEEQIRRAATSGSGPGKPPDMPSRVYDIMKRCCRKDPNQRPFFVQLVRELEEMLWHMESTIQSQNQ